MSRSITIVIQHVGPLGGMERQSTELILGYLRAGWKVTVIARECDMDPHPSLCFVRVRGPFRPFVIGFPWFFFAAGLLTRRHRRGLLHVNGAIVPNRADFATVHYSHIAYGRLGDRRSGSRDTPWHRWNATIAGVMARAAERWCYRPSRIPRLIGISAGVSREIAEVYPYPPDRIHTIPYGVNTEVFRPDPVARERTRRELLGERADRESLVLFVGGDWSRKGLEFVIEALASAPGWKLAVVGAGDEPWAATAAQQHGVADRLLLLGRRTLPTDVFAAADAFCLPTAYETFCLAAHEAAAAGLTLLVPPVSGVEDLIEEGRNGWFIARDGDDIASRLRTLRERPDLQHSMALAARGAGERYDWDLAVQAHIALFRSN